MKIDPNPQDFTCKHGMEIKYTYHPGIKAHVRTNCPDCEYEHRQRNTKEEKRLERIRERIRRENAFKSSGIGREFQNADFIIMKGKIQPLHMKALKVIEGYTNGVISDNQETGQSWLYLYGPPGTGKTNALAAMYNAMVKAHMVPRYFEANELFDRIKKRAYSEGSTQTVHEVVKELIGSSDLIMIDDLIRLENMTSTDREILFNFINILWKDYRPLAIASNMIPKVMKRYTQDENGNNPIFDRIQQRIKLIAMDWASYRR